MNNKLYSDECDLTHNNEKHYDDNLNCNKIHNKNHNKNIMQKIIKCYNRSYNKYLNRAGQKFNLTELLGDILKILRYKSGVIIKVDGNLSKYDNLDNSDNLNTQIIIKSIKKKKILIEKKITKI